MKTPIALATLLLLTAVPLSAQNGQAMISAKDPAGIVRVLDAAGYKAELGTDGQQDPMISVDLAGFNSQIYFYGCDEETHKDCDSLQFSAGFDRKQPWDAKEALKLSSSFRFTSVRLDDEGDPYIMWDIVTGDGIPAKGFLSSVQYFTQAVENAADLVFDGDEVDDSKTR